MIPTLIAAPAVPFVSTADVAENLHLDTLDDSIVLGAVTAAAMSWLDGFSGVLGRCVAPQTWRITLPGFDAVTLPFPDLRSVTVTYRDAANAAQTLSATAYRTGEDAAGAWITFDTGVTLPAVYDRDDAVTIDGVYGFAAVPPAIRSAGIILASHWFANREGAGEVPPAVLALIAPFRRAAI